MPRVPEKVVQAQCVHLLRSLGARGLADELLEHLDGLETIVRVAEARCPACGEEAR